MSTFFSADDFSSTKQPARGNVSFNDPTQICSFEAFSTYFDLPLKDAARKFGVRATAFKKRCRSIGIRHWPYRKVRSLKRSISEFHRFIENGTINDSQRNQQKQYQRQLDKLMSPTTYGLDPLGNLNSIMSDEYDADRGLQQFASSSLQLSSNGFKEQNTLQLSSNGFKEENMFHSSFTSEKALDMPSYDQYASSFSTDDYNNYGNVQFQKHQKRNTNDDAKTEINYFEEAQNTSLPYDTPDSPPFVKEEFNLSGSMIPFDSQKNTPNGHFVLPLANGSITPRRLKFPSSRRGSFSNPQHTSIQGTTSFDVSPQNNFFTEIREEEYATAGDLDFGDSKHFLDDLFVDLPNIYDGTLDKV